MVKREYVLGQSGGNGQSEEVHMFERFAGSYPRYLWSKGGIILPPQATRSR